MDLRRSLLLIPGPGLLLAAGLGVLPAAGPAAADVILPPGFRAQLYVTGEGFTATAAPGVGGIPSSSSLVVDDQGVLFLARTGRRYFGGEAEDLTPLYRIPPGGARLTPDSQARYLYGPPLPNPQVGIVRPGGELLVTTFDRERRIGVVYRVRDGHAELLAGGTPPRGQAPLLRQPEGVVTDDEGHLYVADREAGAVVKLDRAGRLLSPRWISVMRPRGLAMDRGTLWVGSDGQAEAPWQQGPGEVLRVDARGQASVMLRGPIATGLTLGPAGRLFVADRQRARIFYVNPQGGVGEFAQFTENDAPRALAFVPVTPETRRAGMAGDLLVVVIRRGAWPLNEIVRVSGPFDTLGQE